jgi:hypothetical protein
MSGNNNDDNLSIKFKVDLVKEFTNKQFDKQIKARQNLMAKEFGKPLDLGQEVQKQQKKK